MSRYLGPKHKLCRRLGVKVCESAKCPLTRRNYPPGVHGPISKVRLTAYGQQFREKQRARRTYGVTERQFVNYYDRAIEKTGDTGIHLARLLEMRLDNVVYRLHWGQTRPQARQLVSHGYILVNGKRINVPSYQVRTKDVISVKPNKQAKKVFTPQSEGREKLAIPDWLEILAGDYQAKITSLPEPELLRGLFNTPAVVELYSR